MAPLLLSTGQTSNNRVVLRKQAADEAEEHRLAGLQPRDRRQPGTGGRFQPEPFTRTALEIYLTELAIAQDNISRRARVRAVVDGCAR